MTRSESTRGPFAMNVELTGVAIDEVRLNLAGVVRYVEKQGKLSVLEKLRENTPGQVSDDFAVRKRAVDGASHRAEITLAEIGLYRRVGQLAIRERPPRSLGRGRHFAHELRADLVTEPPRSAVN